VTVPLGPAGALKIAYELIDAQARHIERLERGQWGHDTRAIVAEKYDALNAALRPQPGCTHPDRDHIGPCPTEEEDPCTGAYSCPARTGTWHEAHDAWTTPHPDNFCTATEYTRP